MENTGLKLFDTDDSVVLPNSINSIEDTSLVSRGVEEAIQGETVKSLILDEETEIVTPNYVIDLSSLEVVEPIQIMALDALLDDDGDIALYILIKGGMERIGMAYSYKIDRIIISVIASVLGNDVVIYKDYKPGEPAKIADKKNLSILRLTI